MKTQGSLEGGEGDKRERDARERSHNVGNLVLALLSGGHRKDG